ncbi:MAG: EAL domain-containing protein [Xanthomonadales bacterium]|nr:EAL domain-containing protein [Xanthomonadales bacterium]
MKIWYLEGMIGSRKTLQRIRLTGFPFVVGRQEGLSLVLDSAGMSRQHAQLEEAAGTLYLKDLGSTNGTFLNGKRIDGPVEVASGDIIHFAEEEFRALSEEKSDTMNSKMTRQGISTLSENLPRGASQLQQTLLEGMVSAVFQPIVDRKGEVYAYEMLGRGTHSELDEAPAVLFRIAESLGVEVQLSELMRRVGFDLAHSGDPQGRYFANIHPREIENLDRLFGEMEEIVSRYPDVKPILEVHEAAVADRRLLENMRSRLTEMKIQLAYDDFGAGQSRLVELAEVPPDYVKLDMALIKDIHVASDARQKMVQMIVDYARERSILTLAEGISQEGEAQFCLEAGFDYLQGFYFGRPNRLTRRNN